VGMLDTEYPGPAAQRGVLELDPRIVALVGESGGNLAVVELVVAVVGITGAQADARHPGERIVIFPAQVPTPAFQVDHGQMRMAVVVIVIVAVSMIMAMAMIVPVVMAMAAAVQAAAMRMAVLVFVAVPRQAVFLLAVGIGQTQVTAVADP